MNTKLFILGLLSELAKRKTTLNWKAERMQEGKIWEKSLKREKIGSEKKILEIMHREGVFLKECYEIW